MPDELTGDGKSNGNGNGGLTEPADGDRNGAGSDHGGPAGAPPVEVLGTEHRRATPAEAARTIVEPGGQAMLATLTDRPPGHPFGSLVSYALDDAGNPLVVISSMAEHTRNAARDPRASLLVVEGTHASGEDDDGHDPLDAGRVTLLGRLVPVGPAEQAAACARVVEVVPGVGGYAHFRDFSSWRLEVEAVRWVGGFGAMDWIEVPDYHTASADPVLARRRGILGHMNADHADACLDIVGHTLGRPDLRTSRMVAVDRFGCDYRVSPAGGAAELVVRVPFAAPLTGVDDARRELVAQTYAARAARETA